MRHSWSIYSTSGDAAQTQSLTVDDVTLLGAKREAFALARRFARMLGRERAWAHAIDTCCGRRHVVCREIYLPRAPRV